MCFLNTTGKGRSLFERSAAFRNNFFRSKTLITYLLIVLLGSKGTCKASDFLQSEIHIQRADSSEAKQLLLSHKELYKTNPHQAASFARKALRLSVHSKFNKGIIESNQALGDYHYSEKNYDSAFFYYDQELAFSESIKEKKGMMNGMTGKGKVLRKKRKWQEAIELHMRCIEMGDVNSGDSIIVATNYNLLGNIYLDQHLYDKALANYQKGSLLIPGVTRTKVAVTLNMGIIHKRLENLEKASTYYQKGAEMAKALKDDHLIAHSYQKLGSISRDQGKLDQSMKYYRLSLEKFKSLDNKSMIGSLYSNLGDVLFSQERYELAIEEYKASIPYLEEVDDQVSLCFSLCGLGITYNKLESYEQAKKHLIRAKDLSMENGVRLVNRDALLALSEVYASQKDFRKAYQYHLEYKSINDSIFTETKSMQIAEMEAKFETVEKEKAIDLLNAENEINALQLQKQENQRNILIGAILVFMVLVGMLYSRYKTGSRANKKLRQLDELKSKFFTNISHEFRTPLTLILSPIIAMLSKKNSKEEKDQLLVIKRNADRLLELINQLLDLSKLEAGSMRLQVIKGDFSSFIRTIASSFESLAAQKEIKLSIDVPDHSEEVIFDPEKCHQIFFNLLSNAFKFTSKSGEVNLRVAYETTNFSISITDTGKGIPQEDLTNIFKRFHQLGDSKNHQQGTGIGLALVKELVGLHHGEIEVSSEVNVGTTFTTHFPINESVYKNEERREEFGQLSIAKLPSSERPSQTNDSIDGELVLVVEDNDDVRNFIRSIVSNSYEVIEAINGKEGLDIAVEKIPDLIISDLMMPEMDGNEFCKAIKTNETTSHIPVVMLTAKADDQSKTEGFETGADDYLVKPFNEEILKTRIRNLIEQRKRLREKYSNTFSLEPAQIAITPPDELFMKRVKEIVEINISNSEFSIEEFQREIGMSRMQLHRKLKALTNCSASEFIRKQRLRRAAQILKIEGMSVSEAAYSSGFSNLSYFAKCFKEEFGKTPSAYS